MVQIARSIFPKDLRAEENQRLPVTGAVSF